jgi:hypothetical protein
MLKATDVTGVLRCKVAVCGMCKDLALTSLHGQFELIKRLHASIIILVVYMGRAWYEEKDAHEHNASCRTCSIPGPPGLPFLSSGWSHPATLPLLQETQQWARRLWSACSLPRGKSFPRPIPWCVLWPSMLHGVAMLQAPLIGAHNWPSALLLIGCVDALHGGVIGQPHSQANHAN